MAKNKAKAVSKIAETAKESAKLRTLRIDGSQNGATLRTRVVRDKTKYNRNLKHKKMTKSMRSMMRTIKKFLFLKGDVGFLG